MSVPPRVLLVDDSATIRNIIKIYLMQMKLEFVEADSGEKALQVAKQTPPNLIIADVNMPGMGGVQMLQTLRQLAGPIGRVPVVLLTGEKDPEVETKGRDAGANAFIRKPVTADALLKVVREYVGTV